jgi:hypothetical protein
MTPYFTFFSKGEKGKDWFPFFLFFSPFFALSSWIRWKKEEKGGKRKQKEAKGNSHFPDVSTMPSIGLLPMIGKCHSVCFSFHVYSEK